MKFFGRQLPKLCGIYSTIMDINYKDVSFWVQEYIFQGLSTSLSGFKYVSFGVQKGIFWGSRRYLLDC